MRIVAGIARGRRLVAPAGARTRPTPDRVREALFSSLGDAVEDAHVLDLFAGTGALGLEALSRGAWRAVFVDRASAALAALRSNIDVVRVAESSTVVRSDVRRVWSQLQRLVEAEGARPFDLVFADPPYAAGALPSTLHHLWESGILDPRGIVVTEHAAGDPPSLEPERWRVRQRRQYGEVGLTVAEPVRPAEPCEREGET